MKERPILFSASMVRAILEGRKTQTRRICKSVKHPDFGCEMAASELVKEAQHVIDRACPYGRPGDRLWVRETFQGPLVGEDEQSDYYANSDKYRSPRYCEYKADGGPKPEFMTGDDDLVCRWKPSIHMPRWASRITLEITGVRVERLQDISEADAIAEGCYKIEEGSAIYYADHLPKPAKGRATDAVSAYTMLWESINGLDSWESNPYVWVIEFKRVEL